MAAADLEDTRFDNIVNFRDSGKIVNAFLGKKFVKEGLLFRSARPDDATMRDRKRLRDDLGIKTVMDLRTKTEHANQAKKRDADTKVPALLRSNDALAGPVKIEGLSYVEVNIAGRSIERHYLGCLSWISWFKVVVLFLFGFRMQAIGILGHEVLVPRGLSGMAVDTIDHSQPDIAEALHSFVRPGGLPVLVHCTQGKDRTGIVVSLVLMIVGVHLDAIDHDYRLSTQGLQSAGPDRMNEIRSIRLTQDFAKVSPDLNQRVADHIETKYGGLDAYLDGIGFGKTSRNQLRELLLH